MQVLYNLLNLMLDLLELIGHIRPLSHDVLDFTDLIILICNDLVTLLQAVGMTFNLFCVILKCVHDYLSHFGFELKPLRCLRVHC